MTDHEFDDILRPLNEVGPMPEAFEEELLHQLLADLDAPPPVDTVMTADRSTVVDYADAVETRSGRPARTRFWLGAAAAAAAFVAVVILIRPPGVDTDPASVPTTSTTTTEPPEVLADPVAACMRFAENAPNLIDLREMARDSDPAAIEPLQRWIDASRVLQTDLVAADALTAAESRAMTTTRGLATQARQFLESSEAAGHLIVQADQEWRALVSSVAALAECTSD